MDIPVPPKPIQQQDEVEEEIFVVVENPPFLIGGIASVQPLHRNHRQFRV